MFNNPLFDMLERQVELVKPGYDFTLQDLKQSFEALTDQIEAYHWYMCRAEPIPDVQRLRNAG